MAKEENNKTPEEKIAALETEVEKLKKRGGGMLSSSDFLWLVIFENIEQAKKDFWNRQFDKHEGKFIIYPFNPQRLTPFSYDLTVGEQVYSCNGRRVENTEDLEDQTYWMAPRETVVVKTKEFIALPACYSATVWPRFKMPVEAIFQSMVKIDPTWYGELGVAMTNLSGGKYPVKRGEPFATLILYKLTTDTGMYLYREENLPEASETEFPDGLKSEAANIKKSLNVQGLDAICEVVDDKIKFKEAPDGDSYKRLLAIHRSSEWKNTVTKCLTRLPRKMQGLGLNTLEIIRPTRAKVQKLTKEKVQSTRCSETDLENTAIEHGTPFDVLAGIPEFVIDKMEREITPKIQAEVEADVFPKIVTLTLTVLGFLSLIIAVAAFVMDKYRPTSPAFLKIEWSLTATVVVVILGAVLLWAIYRLTHAKTGESRALRRLEKKVEGLEKDKKHRLTRA